eukprot:TRINITY_DN3312_c0_g2_i1.p1 TRINITY_DN3312_c0_g2~~TRINITY_DN3312_c0_g2_i1.p1  ORF type:complete len:533 (+),score=104.11 TRINITY_DN3312_c0_g2_i1:24-1601(+)
MRSSRWSYRQTVVWAVLLLLCMMFFLSYYEHAGLQQAASALRQAEAAPAEELPEATPVMPPKPPPPPVVMTVTAAAPPAAPAPPPALAVTRRPRVELQPRNSGCFRARTREACCGAKDSRYDIHGPPYFGGTDCTPTKPGKKYKNGNVCEPISWAMENGPDVMDYCPGEPTPRPTAPPTFKEFRITPGQVVKPRNGARVAIAVAFDAKYMDGARVLAHSVRQHASKTWPIDMVALVADNVKMTPEFEEELEAVGYRVVMAPLQFNSSQIETTSKAGSKLKNEIDKSGCCGMSELAKLEGYRLVEYEWVMILDADSLVLKPLDELFERTDVDIQYTMDLNLGGKCINGGFAVVRPSVEVYTKIWATIKVGDWRGGGAWGGTGIGYCYGGPTYQGVVPYYFNKVHSRKDAFVVLDSCVWNNMAVSTNLAKRVQGTVPIAEVAVAHFTFCQKPWSCNVHQGQPICKDMHRVWWKARADLESRLGLPVVSREKCPRGRYQPLETVRSLLKRGARTDAQLTMDTPSDDAA